MADREQALTELAQLDAPLLEAEFRDFVRQRIDVLHASAPWGFCSDAAIMQRLLRTIERLERDD